MRAGQVVLERGSVLHPERLGVLASVGRSEVRVVPRPRVAIVPTGDELVEPGEIPGPGQIRNSNAVMLHALAERNRCPSRRLPIAPDEPAGLGKILDLASGHELVLVTGGVSAGQRDLVPDGPRIAGSAQGIPQGQRQAGQAALVRGRPAAPAARVRWSSGCRAIRSAGSSASCCLCGLLWPLWPAGAMSRPACWKPGWLAASRIRRPHDLFSCAAGPRGE